LLGGGPKVIDVKRRGDAGHQYDGAVQCYRIAERRERAEDAVAADHRDLDAFSLRKLHHEGDHALMWKVGALERFVDLDQHGFLSEIDRAQMRADQFEIVRGQRRQEAVGRTRSRVQRSLLL
jgi:hypothetical protein